jgi:hypothetical protein
MCQTILSYLMCLLDARNPLDLAIRMTAAKFNLSQAYVEQLFNKSL